MFKTEEVLLANWT